MERRAVEPRPNWQKRVESHGLFYHTLGGVPYWDETACYQFRPAEIDTIESRCVEFQVSRRGRHARSIH